MKNIVLLMSAICLLTGCGTMYQLVEQPDGTFKRIPIFTACTFLLDLEMDKDSTSTETKPDGTVITTSSHVHYSTKGRSKGIIQGMGAIAQGTMNTFNP